MSRNIDHWKAAGIHFDGTNSSMHARDIGSNNIVAQGDVNITAASTSISQQIFAWLCSPVNHRLMFEEACGKTTSGTLMWFLNNVVYRSWASDDGGVQNLGCVGKPGAGKTILASAVIRDLKSNVSEHSPSHAILYLFFRHDKESEQTLQIVFANLLGQLVQYREPPPEEVVQLFKEYNNHHSTLPAKDRCLEVLKSEIAKYTRVYIVADALDEYSTSDSHLFRLASDLEKLNAKLLITSRNDLPFGKSNSRIVVSANDSDIKLFIEGRMSEPHLGRLIKRSLGLDKEILDVVSAQSEGMFLIPRFHMDLIAELSTPTEVKEALKKLPSGLEGTYQLTLRRIQKRAPENIRRAMSALSWVLKAKRRLTVTEVLYLIAFESNKTQAMVSSDDLLDEEDLLSHCAGLLSIVNSEVQFVHFSAQEFLTAHCEEWFPNANCRIAETCIAYLKAVADSAEFSEPEDPLTGSSSSSISREQRLPLYAYIGSEWLSHVSDVDGDTEFDIVLLGEFLTHPMSGDVMSGHIR